MDVNIKILVVDDFSTMRRILKRALKEMGFTNIFEADDGTTALRALKEEKIGLILADWNMPNMSGLDLLKAVKADDNLKATPFIMVTAEAQKQYILEAAKAGVNNYVIKPFTPETLKEKIEKVFNGCV